MHKKGLLWFSLVLDPCFEAYHHACEKKRKDRKIVWLYYVDLLGPCMALHEDLMS